MWIARIEDLYRSLNISLYSLESSRHLSRRRPHTQKYWQPDMSECQMNIKVSFICNLGVHSGLSINPSDSCHPSIAAQTNSVHVVFVDINPLITNH